MRSILFFILLMPAIAFSQSTTSQLTTQVDNTIKGKVYTPSAAEAMYKAVINSLKGDYVDGTATGTNTYSVTVKPAITAYNTGVWYVVTFTNANSSGTCSLNINAIGARSIKGNDGNDLQVGDIKAGGTYLLQYNGTNLRVLNVASAAGGGGTVESVTGDGVDNTDPANPVISYPTNIMGNAGTATALATGRTISITGDIAYTSPSFDGTGNVTAAGTLATVNANTGTFGSATQSPAITVNGKGLVTGVSNTTITPAVGSITGLGTGVATFLGTPSSSNLATAVTDETGTGALVFAGSPTLTGSPIAPTQSAGTNNTTISTTRYADRVAAIKPNRKLPINLQTSSYTAVATDSAMLVRMNSASANNFTIPTNASVPYPVGSVLQVEQIGAGVTTVLGPGVTLNFSAGVAAAPGRYAPLMAVKIGTDEWDVWNGTPPINPAALTRTNGTYVTTTITGTPATSLLQAVNIMSDLTGTVPVSLGGTGLTAISTGDILYGSATNTVSTRNVLNTTPTALLHLKAGTATASTAPLKLTSGTFLTTPEAGAVEFDGTNLAITAGTTRYTAAKVLSNSATIDFASISGQGQVSNTITVTGAADGDEVVLGYTNAAATTGVIFDARVSATNTVTVTAYNITLGSADPASGTFKVSVIKR